MQNVFRLRLTDSHFVSFVYKLHFFYLHIKESFRLGYTYNKMNIVVQAVWLVMSFSSVSQWPLWILLLPDLGKELKD